MITMGLFSSKKIESYTIVIGCGKLGALICDRLSEKGESVTIIDKCENEFANIAAGYYGSAIEADATDIAALEKAKAFTATTVVCVTGNDNVNIVAAQLAKEVFHVQNVICRLYDRQLECVCHDLNIKTLCPDSILADEVKSIMEAQQG